MLRVQPSFGPADYRNFSVHFARYKFASRVLVGNARSVLDYGCGTGYGSAFLASEGFDVTGTDIAQGSLQAAWNGLYDSENLRFERIESAMSINRRYDAVVSFEVVEHIPIDGISEYFSDILRVLNKDGLYIGSTPRALPFHERSENRQRHHVQEFSENEYRALLLEHFKKVIILSQNDSTISDQSEKMAWNYFCICWN
jgi:2-polyprenyl-3-methyl-5-hydroxy-6-metoxy-1,4-benzoquinol methylase